MLRESERRPLVMPIVLHSFVVGQPYRLRQFRRVIEHILKYRDRVWITRPGEICRFIESLPASIVPGSGSASVPRIRPKPALIYPGAARPALDLARPGTA